MPTRSRTAHVLIAFVVAAVAAAGCSSDEETGTTGTSTTVAAAPAVEGEWTFVGIDHTHTRFTDQTSITADNVGDLAERWHLEDLTGMSGTPAVVDGIVYFGDWNGEVWAVEATTGDEVWRTDLGSTVMSSPTVVGDELYIAGSNELARLDLATGDEVWRAPTSSHPIAISPASPVVVDGIVLQAVASGELMMTVEEYSFRGAVTAFDAESGEQLWQLELTADDETSGAGVGVWSTPAIDEELGLAIFGTGNTYEPPASPMSDSLVAVDYRTGAVAWSRQFTYPDVWSMSGGGGLDADLGVAPNLFEIDGRPVVGAGDKQGSYHVLDRATGEVVWQQQVTVGSILGGFIGSSALGEGRILAASNVGEEGNSPSGFVDVVALDPDDGTELWRTQLEGAVYAPVTATPGLVWVATTLGQMVALDATDGSELWTMDAPDQVGGGAAVVGDTVYWGYGYALFGGGGVGGLYALSPGGGTDATETAEGDDSLGATVYRRSCSACHGVSGQGGTGPSLVGVADRLDADAHEALVREGRAAMPAFGESLTDAEIEAVVAYEREELE